jgi:hypothetical protein
MARRKHAADELPFSLEAFLDIVANLVGILIRLIVMVGLTVRAMPSPNARVHTEAQKKAEQEWASRHADWLREKKLIEDENKRRKHKAQTLNQEREAELQRRKRLFEAHQTQQRDLNRQYDERQRAIAERLAMIRSLEQQAFAMERETKELERHQREEAALVDRELAAARKMDQAIEEQTQTLAELQAALEKEQAELDRERIKRTTLDEQISELKKALDHWKGLEKPTTVVRHFGTSLAERVEIDERHYRCKGGKIVHTHMSDLVEMMRRKLYAAVESKQIPEAGTVGPLGGFLLRYEIGVPPSSLTSQSQRVHDAPHFELRKFVLIGESDQLGESADEAFLEHSAFQRSLNGLDSRKVVPTLWVYPDSFELAKKVEERLHQAGFAVAIRPLTHDMPIAGSPNGSASEAH